MNFFRIFLGYIIQLQVNVTCNPVPNPGTAESSMSFLPTKQNLITDYWHHQEYSRKGEGYHGTTAVVGADRWIDEYCTATANSGQRPPMGYRSNAPIRPQTAVHKRSFKRACTRAIRNGAAHYHGHLMQVRDFPIKLVQKIQQAQQSSGNKIHPMDRQWNHKDRLICLHWNPGGLSQSTLQEVRHWLRRHPADVVVFTETKWSFSSTWEDKDWLYVHSATSDHRSGGILTMISRRLAEPEQLGFAAVIDGRLLHIRIHFDNRALDIIATYQFVAARTRLRPNRGLQYGPL